MTLLSRYILAQFIKIFFTVNVAFASIYILVDFFEKIDNFIKTGKSLTIIVQFFLLSLPFIVDQLGPVLILLAGVITLGILNHNNELTAMKAGGIPLRAIIKPILVGAVLFTMLFLMSSQWLLPYTISRTNTIWYEDVKGMVPLGIYRNGRYYFKGKEGFYSFARPIPEKHLFLYFSYSRWNKDHNVGELLTADVAEWDGKIWNFANCQIQHRQSKNNYTTSMFKKHQMILPETPDRFFVSQHQTREQSLTDLFRNAFKQDNQIDAVEAWTEFYGRLSYIFLGIPLLLLGLPILLLSYQKWGRDLSVAIPASCGMAFVAWGLWGALQSLAKAEYIPILFAATIIHIIFGFTGFYILKKQDL